MFIVPTATKRGKKQESGMAGAAKVPTSTATASKEELKSMAAQMGWEIREAISYEEIQRMSSAELRFREVWNKDALDRAFAAEQNKRTNAERMPAWNAMRMWSGNATDDETAKATAAGAEFAKRFPQFERSLPNAKAMAEFMESHDLDGTELQSYVTAFRELSAEGKLKLAEPQSATDFYDNHKELHPTQIPPLIAARNAKAQATAEHFEQARAATVHAGATSFTEYPERERIGYGDHTRYSFRKLLDTLDADSYKRRLIEDKAFAAAVDKLQSGN